MHQVDVLTSQTPSLFIEALLSVCDCTSTVNYDPAFSKAQCCTYQQVAPGQVFSRALHYLKRTPLTDRDDCTC